MSKSLSEIRRAVDVLRSHYVDIWNLEAYEEYMKKLGVTLGTSVNHYNIAYKELKKVDKDVFRITGETIGVEPTLLDKPTFEED